MTSSNINQTKLNMMYTIPTQMRNKVGETGYDIKQNEATNTDENTFDSNINVIAHRGYSEIMPENTISSFQAAADAGFSTIECDVSWTRDGVPVILHDETINRTARMPDGQKISGKLKCSALDFEELREFDFGIWKGEEFAGEKIPTFDEMLTCAKDNGLNVYIELKDYSGFDDEKAKLLVQAVIDAGMQDNITWISFDSEYLELISKYMPEARLGYLSEKSVSNETIEIIENLKTDENEVFLNLKYSKMSPFANEILDEANIPFEAWTINDGLYLKDLYEYGCEGITTDRLTDGFVDTYLDIFYD